MQTIQPQDEMLMANPYSLAIRVPNFVINKQYHIFILSSGCFRNEILKTYMNKTEHNKITTTENVVTNMTFSISYIKIKKFVLN